jgi:hypothetical protein
MNRHNRSSTVRMFQETVTAFSSHDAKASPFKNSNNVLALEPGKGESYGDMLNSNQLKRTAGAVLVLQAQ